MAAVQPIKREQLRFLRDTARRERELADTEAPDNRRAERLGLASQIDREADDLEAIFLRERC